MKETLLVSLSIPSLGLLTSFGIPAFDHELGGGATTQEMWGASHEAYEDDEWEVLAQAAMQ